MPKHTTCADNAELVAARRRIAELETEPAIHRRDDHGNNFGRRSLSGSRCVEEPLELGPGVGPAGLEHDLGDAL